MSRPPEYRSEYCQLLVDHMTKGFSYESFAATIRTSRASLYNWEKQYPEFLDAKKEAFEQCQYWWEKQGINGLHSDQDSPKINPAMWIFNMKSRFRWKDEDPKVNEIQEREVLTIEDKKKLLVQAKEEIKKLETEVFQNQNSSDNIENSK